MENKELKEIENWLSKTFLGNVDKLTALGMDEGYAKIVIKEIMITATEKISKAKE